MSLLRFFRNSPSSRYRIMKKSNFTSSLNSLESIDGMSFKTRCRDLMIIKIVFRMCSKLLLLMPHSNRDFEEKRPVRYHCFLKHMAP